MDWYASALSTTFSDVSSSVESLRHRPEDDTGHPGAGNARPQVPQRIILLCLNQIHGPHSAKEIHQACALARRHERHSAH